MAGLILVPIESGVHRMGARVTEDLQKQRDLEEANERLKEIYKTDADFFSRDYTIIYKGEILMWIKEYFPITHFCKEIE